MLELNQLRYRHPKNSTDNNEEWSFELQALPASVTSIVGRSGCGKSTLLELIAGLLQPSSGSLTWCGQDLLTHAAGERPISLLFQQHNLFDHLSALENVLLGYRGKADQLARKAARQALEEMGLSEHVHARAGQLSGGQQQRVALARTLLRRSEIVLLDEPFSALDDDTRQSAWPLVRALADKHNCCVLMVTHDTRDSAAVADRVLRIFDGEVSALS